MLLSSRWSIFLKYNLASFLGLSNSNFYHLSSEKTITTNENYYLCLKWSQWRVIYQIFQMDLEAKPSNDDLIDYAQPVGQF